VFAAGHHPMFPGRRLDPRLTLRRPFGNFYRRGPGSGDALLAVGTLERPDALDCTDADVDAFYQGLSVAAAVQVHKGFPAIAAAVRAQLDVQPARSFGLRDHWNWWHANGESDDSGKPLLLSPAAAAAQDSDDVHVFVDDHVEHDHAHIVDVRRATAAGEVVPFAESFNRVMFRAEPFDAIMDRGYFTKLVSRIMSVHGFSSDAGAEAIYQYGTVQ